MTPDASAVALAEGEPVAWAEPLSDRVIVCQGTSLSLVLEACSLTGTSVDASLVADVATDWIVD